MVLDKFCIAVHSLRTALHPLDKQFFRACVLDLILSWHHQSFHHLERHLMNFHVGFLLHHDNRKLAREYARRPNKAGPLIHPCFVQ